MEFRGWMLNVVLGIFSCRVMNLHLTVGQILPPVTCSAGNTSCSITPAFSPWADRKDCKVASVVFPTTEEEIVAAVAEAVKAGKKIRVISKGAHSFPKLVCPRGDDGLLISTGSYDRNIIVDTKSLTATLGAGVWLTPFVDTVAQYGLAFPHSPYWAGLSISGVLSTGAHGSSLWDKGSAVFEYVVGMRIVVAAPPNEGYAKVITLTEGDRDLSAAKLSLGLLGVISTVTLRLQPQFKRSLTFVERSDSDLAEQLILNAQKYEFGDVSWFPEMQKAVYREDNRVPVSTPGEGADRSISFGPIPIPQVLQARLTEEFFESTRNASGKCIAGLAQYQQFLALAYGYTNNGTTFTGYPIVGFQNALQTYGTCESAPFLNGTGYACTWDRRLGLLLSETCVIIPMHELSSFINDIKALLALNPSSLCGLGFYNGILMRYVKKSSDAYLGYTDDGVSMDIVFFRSNDPQTPTLNGDTYDEIAQILIHKYKARPHLGKNRPVVFINSHKRFPNLREFLAVKKRYDPSGIFSNEWTDKVLNIGDANINVQDKKPFCALNGLCICSEDIHCNPSANYFCRPGLLYQKARVCRYEGP